GLPVRAEHRQEVQRQHQRRVTQPSGDRRVVSFDGPDGALNRRDAEPVAVGEDDGEERDREPVDRQPALEGVDACECGVHGYGMISQPNIMAWSSWARLWQCATYGPTKSRKPRYTIVDSPGSKATRSSRDTSSGWPGSATSETSLPLRIIVWCSSMCRWN